MFKNKRISLVITILVVLALGLCSNTKTARMLGERATDKLYTMELQADTDIKLITIDAESEAGQKPCGRTGADSESAGV